MGPLIYFFNAMLLTSEFYFFLFVTATHLLGWSNWTGGRLLSLLWDCEWGCDEF